MDKQLQQWLQVAKQVTLTAKEHAYIRKSITADNAIAMQNTIQDVALNALEKESIKQQLLQSIRTSAATATPWWQLLLPRMHTMALVSIFLVLISASGSAVYAAESALPGDTLYSVKTDVTEPFIGVFHRSTEKRVEFVAWQHQRRTQELERITSDPSLTTDERLEMALERVEFHTQKVELLLKNLPTSASIKIRSDLESRLANEQTLLERLQSGEIAPEQLERMRLKGRLPRPPRMPNSLAPQSDLLKQNMLVPEQKIIRKTGERVRLELRDDRLRPPPHVYMGNGQIVPLEQRPSGLLERTMMPRNSFNGRVDPAAQGGERVRSPEARESSTTLTR